jgi:hypothetical protein
MLWLVIAIAALVVVVAVFALSLASDTDMGGDDAEMQALADLNRLEGPDGKPFFADREAVWDLAEALEDARLGKPQAAGAEPRQS